MAIFQRFKGLGPFASLTSQKEEVPAQQQSGQAEQPSFACRICGHEDLQGGYCPECLADTMEPLRRGADGESN